MFFFQAILFDPELQCSIPGAGTGRVQHHQPALPTGSTAHSARSSLAHPTDGAGPSSPPGAAAH